MTFADGSERYVVHTYHSYLELHRARLEYPRPRYGSVRNSRAAALPKLQRMIILRGRISIAKSPDTFASEIPRPILNSHRACGRLCLLIVVPALNCKERPRPATILLGFQRIIAELPTKESSPIVFDRRRRETSESLAPSPTFTRTITRYRFKRNETRRERGEREERGTCCSGLYCFQQCFHE